MRLTFMEPEEACCVLGGGDDSKRSNYDQD